MKFFLDTANLDKIREVYAMGVLDGVTTNPSLMAKEGIKGLLKHPLTDSGLAKFLEDYHKETVSPVQP